VIEVPKQTFHDCLMAAMTKSAAEEVAAALCEAGWPFVYIEINDNGTWRAVAEDESSGRMAEASDVCSTLT
jgi:hypothetical protein